MLMLLFALIPLALVIGCRLFAPWGKEISLTEIAISAVISVLLGVGLFYTGKHVATSSTEYWNGSVTGRDKDVDRWSESYECNCTGTGDKRTCQTCWRHGYDLDWYAETDIGRIHLRGVRCHTDSRAYCVRRYPDDSFYTNMKIGEPVTRSNTYTNYIRAAGYSLFNKGTPSDGPMSRFPTYPRAMYDHYHLDRVISVGVDVPNLAAWNEGLHQILKVLGPTKQANVVLVLTTAGGPDYANQLMQHWNGAEKNDIVIVAGFPNGYDPAGPAWVKTHAWAMSDIINVQLRDQLTGNAAWASHTELFPLIQEIVTTHFERRPMAEFEYLKDEIDPPTWMVVLSIIIATLDGIGMVFVARRADL